MVVLYLNESRWMGEPSYWWLIDTVRSAAVSLEFKMNKASSRRSMS